MLTSPMTRTQPNGPQPVQTRPPIVIAECEGIQVVRLGLRTTRYRQGV